VDTTLSNNPRRKARILQRPARESVLGWWKSGVADFRENLGVSVTYGVTLCVIGWLVIAGLTATGLSWMILPLIAGGLLIGPVATTGLYQISRRASDPNASGVAAPGQVYLAGVIMMVLLLLWIRSATILFAVFFGLRPFAGFWDTALTLFTTPAGIALFVTGSIVGGLFAAFCFAISVFSFPMLIDREIDGFSAMALSFNATTQNFRTMVLWAGLLTALVAIGVLSGLLLMIPIFPILGYATWHAYEDLFQEQ